MVSVLMNSRMSLDRIIQHLDTVSDTVSDTGGFGDYLSVIVSDTVSDNVNLATVITETAFIDGLIRDLQNLRRLSYIRVHSPNYRSQPLVEFEVEGDIGECAICQEDFQIGEMFVPLPCSQTVSHKYHRECIQPWLDTNNTCPLCRAII